MTPHTASINPLRPGHDPATGSVPRTPPAPNHRSGPRGSTWRVPAALMALSVIPLVAGSLRLLDVAGGPQLIPANPRIDAADQHDGGPA